MVTPRQLAENDERYLIGQFFENVGALVKAYPMRVATENAKVVYYDRKTVSFLSAAFNKASNQNEPSDLQKAAAAKHVYKITPGIGWTASDRVLLDDARDAFKDGGEKRGDSAAVNYMLERMSRLYKVCKLNRIGVSVHTPEHGVIEIDLVPQERPKLVLQPRPRIAPKFTPGRRGF
jgi:activator of 2-hydroxyglutaryl-CoA dehydratase